MASSQVSIYLPTNRVQEGDPYGSRGVMAFLAEAALCDAMLGLTQQLCCWGQPEGQLCEVTC